MEIAIAYGVTLVVAALLSQIAQRSILSTAVLFLLAGFIVGPGTLGFVDIQPSDSLVGTLATLALFTVLFTDGMRLSLGELRSADHLPGRALLFGMT